MELPIITDVKDLRGKKVLLRTAFNVPVTNGEIENDYRIRKVLPTITWLREKGAKIIIISHIWGDETKSLKVVHDYLSKMMEIKFVPDCVGPEVRDEIDKMNDGDVILLENTRLHDGEVGNKESFAEELSKNADIYVNEAFSVSHRKHASVVGITSFLPSYIGLQFKEEIDHLSLVLEPERPFLFILGGAKFSTKMPLIRKYLKLADTVYVAGALVKPFLTARGFKVNQEHVPPNLDPVDDIIGAENLRLPNDFVCFNGTDSKLLSYQECSIDAGNLVDIGETSIEELKKMVYGSSFVLWNGPLGDYEKGFGDGTVKLANIIIESGVKSVVGGGDTVAVLSREGIDYEHGFSFTSTAGGAMLQFLADETLVGMEAIMDNHKNRGSEL